MKSMQRQRVKLQKLVRHAKHNIERVMKEVHEAQKDRDSWTGEVNGALEDPEYVCRRSFSISKHCTNTTIVCFLSWSCGTPKTWSGKKLYR